MAERLCNWFTACQHRARHRVVWEDGRGVARVCGTCLPEALELGWRRADA